LRVSKNSAFKEPKSLLKTCRWYRVPSGETISDRTSLLSLQGSIHGVSRLKVPDTT
jgi:hypothetical protein